MLPCTLSGGSINRPTNPVAGYFKNAGNDSPSPWGEGRGEGGREPFLNALENRGERTGDLDCAGMTALWDWETCLPVGKRRRVAAVQMVGRVSPLRVGHGEKGRSYIGENRFCKYVETRATPVIFCRIQ
jgi:hypothetical protein